MDETEFETLEKAVSDHLEKLRSEREKFRELMDGLEPDDGPVDWRHTENVATRLHNLYMGAEHIFERIAKSVDGGLPDGDEWHKQLLKQMSAPRENRPAVIGTDLRSDLMPYLRFRHFLRQGYGVDTEWEKMTDLIDHFDEVLSATIEAVEDFLSDMRP